MPVVPPIMTVRLSRAESSTSGPREKAFREGGGINEGKHGRARGAPRLECAIIFVMLEIAPADEDKDTAGPIVERDNRALQVFRRGRGRFSLGDLLRRSCSRTLYWA